MDTKEFQEFQVWVKVKLHNAKEFERISRESGRPLMAEWWASQVHILNDILWKLDQLTNKDNDNG